MYETRNVHYYNTRNAGELGVYKDDCGNWVASGLIGRITYMGYTLKETVRRYKDAVAKRKAEGRPM